LALAGTRGHTRRLGHRPKRARDTRARPRTRKVPAKSRRRCRAGATLTPSFAREGLGGRWRRILALAARLRLPAFVATVVLSGFELENLAAGIAANAKGLPGAAAGTFLGGTTFLAAGVAGLGALIAPMGSRLPLPALACAPPR
jgi:hypothetical protein